MAIFIVMWMIGIAWICTQADDDDRKIIRQRKFDWAAVVILWPLSLLLWAVICIDWPKAWRKWDEN
jgi:hypothetical protein